MSCRYLDFGKNVETLHSYVVPIDQSPWNECEWCVSRLLPHLSPTLYSSLLCSLAHSFLLCYSSRLHLLSPCSNWSLCLQPPSFQARLYTSTWGHVMSVWLCHNSSAAFFCPKIPLNGDMTSKIHEYLLNDLHACSHWILMILGQIE